MNLLSKNFLRLFFISCYIILFSGIILTSIEYLLPPAKNDFSIIKHPWEQIIQKIHIFFAPLFIFMLGHLVYQHAIPKFLSKDKHLKKTGTTLLLLVFPAIISGYLIQIIPNRFIINICIWIHIISSMAFTLILIYHLIKSLKYTKKIAILMFIFIIFFAYSPSIFSAIYTKQKAWSIMGTLLTVDIQGNDEINVNNAAEDCWEEINKIDLQMSIYKPNSELSTINKFAYQKKQYLSDTMKEIFTISFQIQKETNNLFNINTGYISEQWGFYKHTLQNINPTQTSKIFYKLQDSIEFQNQNEKYYIQFKSPLTHIDLGGIAKGYALDKAIEKIKNKINCANINLGGQISFLRNASYCPQGKYIIQNPYINNKHITLLLEESASISTSGNYEYFLTDGKTKYGHIIDTKTGKPSQKDGSVSVIMLSNLENSGTLADSLSTALFLGDNILKQKISKKYKQAMIIEITKNQEQQIIVKTYNNLKTVKTI